MSPTQPMPLPDLHHSDTAPGDQRLARAEIADGIKSYLVGLGLAILLTITSFFISGTTLVWAPSIPVALAVLAIAQMGVHLVFFLHITTGPDNVNNVMALAFAVLIILLLLTGSLWIMANLNQNMAFMDESMQTQLGRVPEPPAVAARGSVAPPATASVSARVSGVIQALECDVNMQVKAGQLCAKIDPRPYQLAVDQATASLQVAEALLQKDKADLVKAKAAFERYDGGARGRVISRNERNRLHKLFEKTQAQATRDEARVAELQEALHAAQTNLDHTNIVSPLNGMVMSRNVEVGQTATTNLEAPPLFVFAADLSLIQIGATVSAKDSRKIKPGDKVSFTVEAFPDYTFSGTVTEVEPSRQDSERAATTNVIISAPNPNLLLNPGMPTMIWITPE